MFPGIVYQMSKEMTVLAHSSMRNKVITPPERMYDVRLGGLHLGFTQRTPRGTY